MKINQQQNQNNPSFGMIKVDLTNMSGAQRDFYKEVIKPVFEEDSFVKLANKLDENNIDVSLIANHGGPLSLSLKNPLTKKSINAEDGHKIGGMISVPEKFKYSNVADVFKKFKTDCVDLINNLKTRAVGNLEETHAEPFEDGLGEAFELEGLEELPEIGKKGLREAEEAFLNDFKGELSERG